MRATTSASNIFRRRECPGSGFAEMGILDEQSEYSGEGELLHKLILARISKAAAPVPNGVVITPAQAEVIEEAVRLFDQFEAEIRERYRISDDEPFGDECEQELMVRADDRDLFPGHSDIIRTWYGAGVRIVVDFKFGFLAVEEAPDNLQLASYAVGAYQRQPIMDTAVAIIQPRNFGPRITRAVYDPEQIGRAQTELQRIDWLWREPNAPRIAGQKQCTHCKAKLFCDAYKAKYLLPASTGVRDLSLIDDAQLGQMIEAAAMIATMAPRLKAEARKRLAAGGMDGWMLGNTGSEKTLTDASAAYRRLLGFFPEEPDLAQRFMACLKPKWGELTDLAIKLTGLPQKKARAKLEEMWAGLIEEEEKEKSLKRV